MNRTALHYSYLLFGKDHTISRQLLDMGADPEAIDVVSTQITIRTSITDLHVGEAKLLVHVVLTINLFLRCTNQIYASWMYVHVAEPGDDLFFLYSATQTVVPSNY